MNKPTITPELLVMHSLGRLNINAQTQRLGERLGERLSAKKNPDPIEDLLDMMTQPPQDHQSRQRGLLVIAQMFSGNEAIVRNSIAVMSKISDPAYLDMEVHGRLLMIKRGLKKTHALPDLFEAFRNHGLIEVLQKSFFAKDTLVNSDAQRRLSVWRKLHDKDPVEFPLSPEEIKVMESQITAMISPDSIQKVIEPIKEPSVMDMYPYLTALVVPDQHAKSHCPHKSHKTMFQQGDVNLIKEATEMGVNNEVSLEFRKEVLKGFLEYLSGARPIDYKWAGKVMQFQLRNEQDAVSFIETCKALDLLPELKAACDSPAGLLSDEFKAKFLAAHETAQRSAASVEDAIQIIEVEEIAVAGDADELLAADHGVEKDREAELPAQYRLEHALNTLGDLGIANRDMVVYKESAVEGRAPFSLVDVNSEKLRAQILLCDYHYTYINRAPEAFNPEKPIVISDWKDNNAVWQFKLANQKQWLRDLRKYLETPVADLPVQQKHLVAWPKNGPALMESFIATLVNDNEIPKAHDRTQIAHGPLSRIRGATFAKACAALNSRVIPMFDREGVTTLHELYCYAAGENPILVSFLHAEPIKADAVIADVKKITARERTLLSDEFFEIMDSEGITIAGRKPAEVKLALKYGAVQGLGNHIPAQIPGPQDIAELQIALGLMQQPQPAVQ